MIGTRVEMLDGSLQGTVVAVPAPNFWEILWDDGESGAVHPLGVKVVEGSANEQSELELPHLQEGET